MTQDASPPRRSGGSRARGPGGRFVAAAPTAAPTPGLALYLLRHADAGDPALWAGDDADRPLSKKGRRQARRLGRHLDGIKARIDAIATSPKVRAADTARIVGKALGVEAAIEDRLGGGFDAAGLEALVDGLGPEIGSLMLVAHDPDLSALASWLADAPLALRKGALARIDLHGRRVAGGSGVLAWLLPPDALRG